MLKIGDKVRVVADVWDDHREKSWLGWVGVVKGVASRGGDPYHIHVHFPKSRGRWRNYDFLPEELQTIQ